MRYESVVELFRGKIKKYKKSEGWNQTNIDYEMDLDNARVRHQRFVLPIPSRNHRQ
jgi:hypothetical protein